MREKLSGTMRPLLWSAVVWLGCVVVLFLIKDIVELFSGPIGGTWIDLTLVLTAYLLFFLLGPLQHRINRRLHKRARKRSLQETGSNV